MDSELILKYGISVARFVACLLIIQVFDLACTTIYTAVKNKRLPEARLKDKHKLPLYALVASAAVVVSNNEPFLVEQSVVLLMAYAVVRYLESKRQKATISYGEGMACSYVEGYLYQVIPSDGARFVGLQEQIRAREEADGVPFPVRRLFIIITKSLYCPPNLEAFNKADENLPKLELCLSVNEVQRNVAGVRDRVYRNSVYRVWRRARDPRPAPAVAEGATPLHTLWRVLQRRAVYRDLAAADAEEIAASFCSALERIVASSPELRGRCELVHYDDTNPEENLAEVLLAKIRELEPNFDN